MGLMVLLARVVLQNPNLESAWQYVKEFFVSYSQWPWPRPVQLGHIEANDASAPVAQVWNPMVTSCYTVDLLRLHFFELSSLVFNLW